MQRRHPIIDFAIDQNRKRSNAKILGAVFVLFIVMILGGIMFVGLVAHTNAPHRGVYISVITDKFVNGSGSWSFVTTVKNTGTVFIDSVTISVPDTGSTIGMLSSIPVGGTSNGTFPISGITNNTLYVIEYYAVSGNLTYDTNYPVLT